MSQRFVVVRAGYLCWWKDSSHAERGMPPRGRLYFAGPGEELFENVERRQGGVMAFGLRGTENLGDGKMVARIFEIEAGFDGFREAVEVASGRGWNEKRNRKMSM